MDGHFGWTPVWFEGNELPDVHEVDSTEDEFSENEEEKDVSEESGDAAVSSDDSNFVESCDDLSDDDDLDF